LAVLSCDVLIEGMDEHMTQQAWNAIRATIAADRPWLEAQAQGIVCTAHCGCGSRSAAERRPSGGVAVNVELVVGNTT
jgi:hypothetical protein